MTQTVSIESPSTKKIAADSGATAKAALQDIGMLVVLLLALPINAALVLFALAVNAVQQVIDFDFSKATRPYILKSIPYDAVRRLNLTQLPCPTPEATAAFAHSLPISEETPWIMQEFIVGKEYCTHSMLREGELRMHCCCESSAFQINYENVDKPEIKE